MDLLKTTFGIGATDDEGAASGLGTDMFRMFASFPLSALVGFSNGAPAFKPGEKR